jgi:hypothetical protein
MLIISISGGGGVKKKKKKKREKYIYDRPKTMKSLSLKSRTTPEFINLDQI